MDKGMAHALLNQAKLGMGITLEQINEALLKTGDLDVFRNTEQPNRTLCTDGFESSDERNSWPAEMEAMERQVNILTDALAKEREACANLVFHSPPSDEYESPLRAVYNAIRARSNT